MASISLCMIVRDEEAVLGRCLESVAPAVDEIIVVDTGSVDGTKAVAAAYTDRIFDFAWVDDFAAARNASFAKATGDYILWLDADDVLLPEDLDALLCLKNRLDQSPADVVMMRYNTGFDSRGNPTFFFDRERLVRRAARPVWYGRVHEYIQCPGTRITVNIAVTHRSIKTAYTTRNLRIYEKMAAAGELFTPRDRFYYGRELYYHRQYDRAVQELQAFLAPGDGWLPDQLEACKSKGIGRVRLLHCAGALPWEHLGRTWYAVAVICYWNKGIIRRRFVGTSGRWNCPRTCIAAL